jgi:hypothetical protein
MHRNMDRHTHRIRGRVRRERNQLDT